MTNSKMTNSQALAIAISTLADMDNMAEVVEKLGNMKASVDKKSANKKVNEENEGIKATILATLEGAEPMTITEMQKANAELGALSNQKVSSLVRQLTLDGTIAKVVDKKVSRFSLA